jgi:hypothetical protein
MSVGSHLLCVCACQALAEAGIDYARVTRTHERAEPSGASCHAAGVGVGTALVLTAVSH